MGAMVDFCTVYCLPHLGFLTHFFVHKQCQWLSPCVVDVLTFFFSSSSILTKKN